MEKEQELDTSYLRLSAITHFKFLTMEQLFVPIPIIFPNL